MTTPTTDRRCDPPIPHLPDPALARGLHAAGEAAGRAAGTWWARHVLCGPPAEARLAAQLTLSGIDANDPDLLDTLPRLDATDLPTDATVYAPAAAAWVVTFKDLDNRSRHRAVVAYRASHDTALLAEVSRRCRAALGPAHPEPFATTAARPGWRAA